jgi:hypothetical protein
MYRLLLILSILLAVASKATASVWYSVNYDKKTVAAMTAAFGTETATEMYYSEQVKKILERYSAAEVATAGIFMSKYLDRKALTDLGIWSSATENYYYRRIYSLVSAKIMPKIWTVAGMMLRSPQTALYWGSYLFKVCHEVETLCMQFESVVTNSSLSFRDVVFLQLAPQFQPLFDLAGGGNVDWKRFFDDLGSIPGHFSRENLETDIGNLYDMGVSIAGAGAENMLETLLGGSSFNDLAKGNVIAIVNAAESSYGFYKALEHDLGGTLLSMVGGPENVARLFSIDSYNMTSWMTDYLRETMGQYYTQRWYIYRRDSGSETLCDYMPPTDDNSILYGSAWTRFNTTDADFYPSSAQTEQILSNSESHAGCSREKVRQMNASGDGFHYSISYSRYAYILSKKDRQYAKSYAYSIRVTKSWNRTEEIYEDVFDSYSMDLNTFRAQLNARLSEFNDNEEGIVYYIGSDGKNYYQATDEAKMKGTESVIISVTCHDGFTISQGNTQYKCRTCGGSLNGHSKECAMQTTLTDNSLDLSELDRLETEYNGRIAELQTQIDLLNAENQQIVRQIASATVEEAAALRQQYNANKSRIESLSREQEEVRKKLADLQAAREEASAGEDVPTDDYYRIPAIMNDCKTAFDLTWQGEGHWEGYSYVRTTTSGSMDAVITFKATLSIARKPKYFLGIKIHRAIMQIEWSLTADYSDTQVVDVLQLDPDKSDRENAATVNARISEIARDYPSCTVSTEYIRNEPLEQDNSGDTYHLLWSSDRLEIAREVDSRLTRIYADLVCLEKMMHYKLSIIDVLKNAAPYINDEQGRRRTILDGSFARWMKGAGSRNYRYMEEPTE